MEKKKLLEILLLASEFKEGDVLLGGTKDEVLRKAAREELSAVSVGEINRTVLIGDGVSYAFAKHRKRKLAAHIEHLTIGEVKQILIGNECARFASAYRDGFSSEAIAAIAKMMTDEELGAVARSIYNPLPGQGVTVGSRYHFGSRIQPNSAGDDLDEILFSILECVSYGCGDVMIGLNPACDDVEKIIELENFLALAVTRLELPTRWCVLSDIVKQTRARERGAKVDLVFQSIAGTSKALKGMVGLDVGDILELARGARGLYFETGQGSEASNSAADGVDMGTLESRTYGVARFVQQETGLLTYVNNVAGFIGPEIFRTEEQLYRVCLEDVVMAKLHGLTFGLDVCSTFHMGISPRRLCALTEKIVEDAAPGWLMAVPGNADPMLGYLTTSPREHARIRLQRTRHVTSEMQRRFAHLGVLGSCGLPKATPEAVLELYVKYKKAGGDTRYEHELRAEASRKISALQKRNFDIGYGCPLKFVTPPEMKKRADALYEHAKHALCASLEDAVLADVSPKHLKVKTLAVSRDEYISRPFSGNTLRGASRNIVRNLRGNCRPDIAIVLSDGLNANALNENIRVLLPAVRYELAAAGFRIAERDIVVINGRVRSGYDIGMLLEARAIIHFIGERPGTGLDAVSAYITYGKDERGNTRFRSDMDHSLTSAVCGIHKRGKHPDVAVGEIVHLVKLMFERHCSGVELYAVS
jgi:ethanolamine ammonia-lyase large subunit